MEAQVRPNSKKSDAKEWLQEAVTLSMYYDFYGELLSEHHKTIFEAYIWNDMSLAEIAEECSLSRQGVYDIVKRCSKKLRDYEEKLHLVQRFQSMKERIAEIDSQARQICREPVEEPVIRSAERIFELAEQVMKEL